MKCEMPDCENDSVKTISENSIHFGVNIEDSCINICEFHDINELHLELQRIGEQQAETSQIINPFLKCKSLNRSCI
jgi:hypothetical protein